MPTKEPSRVHVCYGGVRYRIRSGDLLLFRSPARLVPRLLPQLIGGAGRSPYCHAAMAAWWDGRLMALEMVQFRGGRAVLLSNLVRWRPARIDVYQAGNPGDAFDRRTAVEAMKEMTGRTYGWLALMRCGLMHVPIVRQLLRPAEEGAPSDRPPFCSMAVAAATRAGGVDPVPNLADRYTEPGDLARSPFYRYRFTLMP